MKRRGMALGLAALMTCTALFTTTANAENKGSDEKETIKFTYWGSGDEKKAIEESVDKFMEANPNIEVDLMHIPSEDFLTKLNAMIAAGEAPDVSYSASWKCQMGEDGLIYNFYDLLDDMGLSKDDYLSTCWWNWSPTESAGPVQANVTTNLMYNVDCFEEAGVDLPPTKVEDAWSWDEFVETAKTIKKKTGKYGICSGVADDTNIFNYWVRSHGEQLFSDDNKSLGYDDDQILVDYLDMWKDLMDCDAEPDPDEYTQIQSLGQEAGPVVTGDAAMLNENNNYASKMSSANPNLKVTIPPVSDINKKAIWNKPSYMLCISEKSKVKKEAAEFINWFINSEESNDIMMAERGVPSPQNIRDHLLDSGKLNEKQQEMFEYADQVVEYTGDTPDPDPMGISEVSKSLQDCAYSAFYGNITTKEAAEKFRKEANEILERNN